MPEYIEKETALAQLMKLACKVDEDKYVWVTRRAVFHMLDDSPSADVAPVRHGHWGTDKHGLERSLCSECGAVYEGGPYNFCPKCGARMDAEGGDDK